MTTSIPLSRPGSGDRGGFALVMVVMLLLTVAVAGATGYQIVSAENELAKGGEAQMEALAVARAGLERYVGEHIGVPGATTTYAIGSGTAVVTQRKLVRVDTLTDVWMIQSVGTMPDPRYPTSPATRTVRQYARLYKRPVNQRAAVIWNSTNVRLRSPTTVNGSNGDNSWDTNYPEPTGGCAQGVGGNVTGVASLAAPNVQGGATLSGGSKTFSTMTQLLDTTAVSWSVLDNLTFPVPYDGSWPNFNAIPADSFPVIRVAGNISLDAADSGRGALIVTGNATMGTSFTWRGIIIAGSSSEMQAGFFGIGRSTICGMLVTGLDATQGRVNIQHTLIQYQEYAAVRANRSLAYFELLNGSRWEF